MLAIARTAVAIALTCLAALQPQVHAQQFPTKPVRLVSPFPPGGANDIVARVVAAKLSSEWGEQVIVDNRAGAAGAIGSAAVAKAEPDGYTLVMGTLATHGINALIKDLPYDPMNDFAPITLVASIPIVLVVHPSLDVSDLHQLITMARQKPGALNFASSGTGSVNHLAGELFTAAAEVDIVHVGYKGSAPALADTVGGQVKIMFDLVPSSLPHIKSGRLRALAVTSAQRTSLLPDVPTMAESGLGSYEATSWFGILAPAGTPRPIVEKLNQAIVKILRTPEVREVLSRQGAEPIPSTPDEFTSTIRADLARWSPIVERLNLKR